MEWTTGQVATSLGVPLTTIRYWIRRGLVAPASKAGSTYLFTSEDLERFCYIHRRRQEGVGLTTIQRELSLLSPSEVESTPQSPSVRLLHEKMDPPSSQLHVLVLANQKGGVGKTTSAINLGAALVKLGKRVLLVDWDPQANASQALGLTHWQTEGGPSVFDCVHDEQLKLSEVIRHTKLPGLDLAPANIQLSGLELDLASSIGREAALHTILGRQRLSYDYVVIDTPPALGLITVNALVAGQWVIIPVQAEYLSLEGVRQLMNTMDIVRRRLNPDLRLLAVLITMFDDTEPLAASVRLRIEEVFDERVPTVCVPRSSQVIEAQIRGIPLAMMAPTSPVVVAYERLASKILTAMAERRGALR